LADDGGEFETEAAFAPELGGLFELAFAGVLVEPE
jgi:hypothetical protein